MRVLFSLLGRPLKNRDLANTDRYATATYRFAGGDEQTSPIFCTALLKHQEHVDKRISKLVVLGTTGSVWASFLEAFDLLDTCGTLWSDLITIEEDVASQTLSRLGPALLILQRELSRHLEIEVHCHIINTLVTEEQQRDFVDVLLEHVEADSDVFADVTHGLGHQRISLALTATTLLTALESVATPTIYAGAYDLRDAHGVCPVVELSGTQKAAALGGALGRFEASGDIGHLRGSYVPHQALPAYDALVSAVRLNQPADVIRAAEALQESLASIPRLTRVQARIQPILEAYTASWRGPQVIVMLRQAKLAIAKGDILSGVVLAFEALQLWARMQVETGECDGRSEHDCLYGILGADATTLGHVRHAIVHGSPPGAGAALTLFKQGERAVGAELTRIIGSALAKVSPNEAGAGSAGRP